MRIIYFPACISRLLGSHGEGKPDLMEMMIRVSNKAGIQVIIPEHITGTCCGQIFSSKGFPAAYRYTVGKIIDFLWTASGEGKYPIVTDASSCAHTFHHIREGAGEAGREKLERLRIMDSVDYLYEMVLPLAKTVNREEDVVLHPVCSLVKMGTYNKFVAIARHFARSVTVPLHTGCCGMAGDRGFLFPELTSSATAAEAEEVKEKRYDGYYSSAKTCEMAMADAVQQNYESILYLADQAMG
jgi:D-lactate dehydrogenase